MSGVDTVTVATTLPAVYGMSSIGTYHGPRIALHDSERSESPSRASTAPYTNCQMSFSLPEFRGRRTVIEARLHSTPIVTETITYYPPGVRIRGDDDDLRGREEEGLFGAVPGRRMYRGKSSYECAFRVLHGLCLNCVTQWSRKPTLRVLFDKPDMKKTIAQDNSGNKLHVSSNKHTTTKNCHYDPLSKTAPTQDILYRGVHIAVGCEKGADVLRCIGETHIL